MTAKPSAAQYRWHETERIMFICLDPATWQNREYDDHSTPLSSIDPHALDTDQWCEAAVSWGAKQILHVAKHVGGFCWWQTDTSDYGVKETPWRDGKGDVVADLSRSCEKFGLRLGIYLSPADDLHDAGVGAASRDAAKRAEYETCYRRQLTELLSRYGEISEVWFDGNCVIPVDDILKRYAPGAVVFQSPSATIRWCGNETGYVPYPAWNSLSGETLRSGGGTSLSGDPDGDAWAPIEADTTLYDHFWFWSEEKSRKVKSLEQLVGIYYRSAGHGAVMLLNANPDTSGRIPEADMKLYRALGEELEGRFGVSIAESSGIGRELEIDLRERTSVNHAVVMEDYREGERIREYRIEGFAGGKWRVLAEGTAVGRMKIDDFDAAAVEKVRLMVSKAVQEPLIRKFAVYHCPRPDAGVHDAMASSWNYLRNWTVEEVEHGGRVLSIDLSTALSQAGIYEVQLNPTNTGAGNFEVSGVSIILDGYESPEMIERCEPSKQSDEASTYRVKRSAVSLGEGEETTVVRFTFPRIESCGGGGNVFVRKAL